MDMMSAVNHHRDLAERDLDGLQAFSLDLVRRVEQTMAKEKCFVCFGEKCCMIWRKILYVFDFGEKSCIKMSGAISRPSGAPTPPNLRFMIKYRNVSRIG